jgi:exosortase H (IPTLxxWG-CTERM-specific)
MPKKRESALSTIPSSARPPSPGRGEGDGREGQGVRSWQRNRREITFLVVFAVLLGGGFTLISLQPVNDRVVEPFTAGIARASGAVLDLLGQDVTMQGTIIRSPRFAVNIRNGCNGVEAMMIFLAAVLAFPAPWRSRVAGLALGILAIQVVNLIRVVALFLTGAYFPKLFDTSHTVIWQTVVILFGVLLWIFWANRLAAPRREPAT